MEEGSPRIVTASTPDRGEEQSRSERRKVLLVDADAGVRVSLGRALESEHYSVIPVGEVMEALWQLHSASVDLVLLDVNLPEEDGWNLCERIKATHPSLPIIVIDQGQGRPAANLKQIVALIMEKPLALPVLIQEMGRLLGRAEQQRLHEGVPECGQG